MVLDCCNAFPVIPVTLDEPQAVNLNLCYKTSLALAAIPLFREASVFFRGRVDLEIRKANPCCHDFL
jgi:hypothetical protein